MNSRLGARPGIFENRHLLHVKYVTRGPIGERQVLFGGLEIRIFYGDLAVAGPLRLEDRLRARRVAETGELKVAAVGQDHHRAESILNVYLVERKVLRIRANDSVFCAD